ncbi:phage regulatory protein/antirepressor Ant [Bacteroides fragilis]|uniref:phage regulatory protein/antirepressor Ant n=1 Tax=Bacteroides fragilis TaxID=817 RepID=UPI002176DBE7|nr:phage regulatory protein/antirepressor Ant [Bacteroides fragilis]
MANLFDVKTMSSLQIAELTGKQHSNVMRDIRNILEQLEDRRQFNFELSSRTQPMPNGGSKEVSCYILTKKDCLLLASGYDANLRAKIINRWEELETKKRELSRKELALMVLQSEEEKERLALEVQQKQITIELQEKEIKESAPKINYYDNHLQSVNTLTSTQVAKQIGMDAEKLHRKMKEIGILYKQSGQWILHAPYSTWGLHSTRTQTYTRSDGSTGTSVYTVWTTKGVRFIIALYENEWNVKKAIKQIKSEVNPAA